MVRERVNHYLEVTEVFAIVVQILPAWCCSGDVKIMLS